MSETTAVPESFSGRINALAGVLSHGGAVLSAGDRATLRRMDPRSICAPGFYKLAGTVLSDALPAGGAAREEAETRWSAIVVALAHLGDLHRPGVRMGEALVEAGFSEARFVRLLRADADRLVDELPALGRFLAAKSIAADFTEAARLLLSAGRSDEERTRRQLARDFYGALARQESTRG